MGKRAEKIITRNDKVTGVRLRHNFIDHIEPFTIACDNVVANCALPIVPDLLDEPHATSLRRQIDDKTNPNPFISQFTKPTILGEEPLSFIRPVDFRPQKGQHSCLNLLKPKLTDGTMHVNKLKLI